ncbi:hypothetical protein [Oceanobacillus massiliensis]|uniref:hypothetical protein n=1 Tax=Oceanobacillus massiliensis TaxID=1465765 RepID=UPI000289149F|nr:hypothetical protein [Oceanobacillus massiliensis]
MIILLVLSGLLIIFALFYTLRVGKTVETKGESDTEFKGTRRHPILLNPALYAYLLGFIGIIIYIAYMAMAS